MRGGVYSQPAPSFPSVTAAEVFCVSAALATLSGDTVEQASNIGAMMQQRRNLQELYRRLELVQVSLGGIRPACSATDDLICGSQALKESEESLQAQLECNDFVGALKLSSESAAVVSIKLSSESAAVVGIKLSSESAAVVCLDPHWVVADE